MKTITIDLVIYPYNIDVIYRNSASESIGRLLQKLGCQVFGAEVLNSAKGWTLKGKKGSVIVLNRFNMESDRQLYKTIRHETHHACADVFEYIQHKTKRLDEEPFLYLNDYVFDKILEFVER